MSENFDTHFEDLIVATGRRRIRIFRDKDHPDKVYLEILLGKDHLATLELDKGEAGKLALKLGDCIAWTY